ncbi:MAG: hypothetical protein R6V54_10255 [Desulfobacteraceae bacterium]
MTQQSSKHRILERLYRLHRQWTETAATACCRKCSSCCTCNVTMTSLEAEYLLAGRDSGEKERMVNRVRAKLSEKRFRPRVTFNRFARLCMDGETVPEEENDPLWGECPLLENDECTVYRARPFGCRSLVSQKKCLTTGAAEMPPHILTINNVFMQYIEHLDAEGGFGNLSDMVLLQGGKPQEIEKKKSAMGIIENHPAPLLMVPPEHKTRVQPLLEEISRIFDRR